MGELSHTDKNGKARMVDVGGKDITERAAVASITVLLNEEAFTAALENRSKKGDVLTTAKLAGIQAAKKTSELIPLCHQINLDHVDIEFDVDENKRTITAIATVRCTARTGIEMEALTACSITALTIYDMLKAIQKDIVINDLKLLKKTGGKSGEYIRKNT
jgi:molybdenum cofactor biosynthesis protein MoaC